jgi:hypothetical protein
VTLFVIGPRIAEQTVVGLVFGMRPFRIGVMLPVILTDVLREFQANAGIVLQTGERRLLVSPYQLTFL